VAGAKRRHYVPRNYLERFADGDLVFVGAATAPHSRRTLLKL
jgi:hypothetical protein